MAPIFGPGSSPRTLIRSFPRAASILTEIGSCDTLSIMYSRWRSLYGFAWEAGPQSITDSHGHQVAHVFEPDAADEPATDASVTSPTL